MRATMPVPATGHVNGMSISFSSWRTWREVFSSCGVACAAFLASWCAPCVHPLAEVRVRTLCTHLVHELGDGVQRPSLRPHPS